MFKTASKSEKVSDKIIAQIRCTIWSRDLARIRKRFKDHDLGRTFHPHITFSFRDIPNDLYDNVFAWMEAGPDLKGPFLANTFHFMEVFSKDWSGSWWDSLTWRLLKSWHLTPEK